MYRRFITHCFPKESFFVFGPRQVGKTTVLKEISHVLMLNFLDPSLQLEYTQDPKLLYKQIQSLKVQEGWVILDEIQRVAALLDVVQMVMQDFPKIKFVMSGSSVRKLRRNHANLLGGRAIVRELYPLTASELGPSFDLESVLCFGSLPKIYTSVMEGEKNTAIGFLKSYLVTYLNEEIKSEALVRSLRGFQNFLEIAGAQFSQQVNLSEISRLSRVSYSTVREFYSILEDTLIGFFLRPYVKSAKKRMSQAPKFYFFDNGVTRAITKTLSSPASFSERGFLFEQWMLQEAVRINSYYQKDWNFYFWRTSHGAEVDLIVEKANRIIYAFEFKSNTSLSSADLTGLKAFLGDHPRVSSFVVAPVNEPLTMDGIKVITPEQFLKLLSEEE